MRGEGSPIIIGINQKGNSYTVHHHPSNRVTPSKLAKIVRINSNCCSTPYCYYRHGQVGGGFEDAENPSFVCTAIALTYRYIAVLMEEVARMLRAYSLRAPEQKGIHRSVWGSFAGQLILRTYERAQHVYQAMCLRGFAGEYNTGGYARFKAADLVYLAGWILFFAVARIYNIPVLIGLLITGVGR